VTSDPVPAGTSGTLTVLAPVPGRALPLSDVPDPVFAAAMLGAGAAVDPDVGVVEAVSPVDGTLVKLHPHAYVVLTAGGVGVLVHLGIDTVQLAGAPFTLHVAEGALLRAGERVVTWDVAATTASGRSAVVPVIVMEVDPAHVSPAGAVPARGHLAAGEALLSVQSGA